MTTYHDIPLESLLDRIASGDSVAKIARELKVSRQALNHWLNTNGGDEYREAQRMSADGLMDKAEEAILDESIDIARARELANHYRHVAKARDPQRYGDKLKTDNTHAVTLTHEQALSQLE